MEVVLLLFLLAGASHGIETSCDARQSGAQCYGALNGTVFLHLTDKIKGHHIKLTGDQRKRVFKTKSGGVVYFDKEDQETTDGRIYFEKKNGTLRIHQIGKEYSDNYTLETTPGYNTRNPAKYKLQLSIEVPVSSPRLVISECLLQGQMRMSCSCEGDSPRYSWTLDGRALNDSRVVHDKERSSVTLERGTEGKLTCTVNNHISQATVDFTVDSTCNDTIVIVAGSLAGVLLLAVLLGIYFVLCRKKTAASAEDEGEVIYANVQYVTKNQERQKKKKQQAPVEVEYGQVKMSGAAGRQVQRPRKEVEYGEVIVMTRPGRKVDKPQEECVYSSIR